MSSHYTSFILIHVGLLLKKIPVPSRKNVKIVIHADVFFSLQQAKCFPFYGSWENCFAHKHGVTKMTVKIKIRRFAHVSSLRCFE
jgi:hypothetical protein